VRGYFTNATDIAELLKLVRNLQTFDFEQQAVHGAEPVYFRNLLHDITHQYRSLTSLRLGDSSTIPDLCVLEILKDLNHLQFLELDVTITLMPHDQMTGSRSLSALLRHLPTQLEELALIANDPDSDDLRPSTVFVNALHTIAPTTNTIFPALNKLAIINWDPLLGTFPCQIQLKALQLAFATAHVKFVSRPLDSLWSLGNDEDLLGLEPC
jgi:hypothetical protein